MQRKLDELGRIVLPVEMRNRLGVKERALLEVTVEDEKFIITPVKPACRICGGTDNLRTVPIGVGQRQVCSSCIHAIQEMDPNLE